MRGVAVAAVVGSAFAAATLAGAGAAATGAPPTRIWAFSDANPVHPASTYTQELQALRPKLCATAERGSKPLGLTQALARLRAALPRKALTFASAAQAEAVAAAAIGKAKPGVALAALLLAHDKDPQDARPLENAAVVATSLGRPQEALSLLTAASHLPERGGTELGIDRTARELNNKSYALIRLGRWSQAVPLLRSAIAREPLLDEAERNLAVAESCLGNTTQGGADLRKGLRRNHFQDVGDASKLQYADPSKAFDLSKGQPMELPVVVYPKTLDAAAGAADKFESDYHSRYAEGQSLLDQSLSLPSQSSGHSGLTTLRILHMEDLSGNEQATPQIAQLWTQWQQAYKAAGDVDRAWGDEIGHESTECDAPGIDFAACVKAACTAYLPGAQRNWYAAATAADHALRAWVDAFTRLDTGLASNVKDPAANRWILVDMQFWVVSNYALLLQEAWSWTSSMAGEQGTCFDQQTDAPAETSDGKTPSIPPCTGAAAGVSFTLDLELFAVTVSCEEVELEASGSKEFGPLLEAGPFSSVSYKFKTGSTTLMVGGEAGVKGGIGARGGVYVTWDQHGNITDVGARGDSTLSGKAGPATVGLAGPGAHVSFIGAADDDEE
jgi:tetratricopeptide (TPR) repeat protein